MCKYPSPRTHDGAQDRSVPRGTSVMLSGLCVLILFAPLLEGGTTQLAVMIIRLLVCGLIACRYAVAVKEGTFQLPRTSLDIPVLVFLVLSVMSVVLSAYTNHSVQWLVVLVSYAGFLYFVVIFLDRWEHLFVPFLVLTGTAAFEAVWGLAQVFALDQPRATGTFFNPNFLAGYLVLVWMPVLAYCGFFPYRRLKRLWSTDRDRFWPSAGRFCVPMGLCALLLLGIVATGSRAGILLVILGSSLVIGARIGRLTIGILLGLILVLGVVPNPVRDRLITEHTANPFAYTRLQMWQAAGRMMQDHPFGIGLGLYQYVSPRYAFPVEGQVARHERVAQTPHNEFLQIGAELGIAAVVVFAFGIGRVCREVHRQWVRRLSRWERMVLVGLSGSVLTVLVHALLDSNLHEPGIAIQFVLLLGSLLSFSRLSRRAGEHSLMISIRSQWKWQVVGILLLTAVVSLVLSIGMAWLEHAGGMQLAAQGDLSAAINKHQRSVNWDPGKALYRNSLAATYYQLYQTTGNGDELKKALHELGEAIRLNPLDHRLQALRGFVHFSLAKDARKGEKIATERVHLMEALESYQVAYNLAPFNAEHVYHAGLVTDALGESGRAQTYVRQAIDLEPNFLVAREWLVNHHLANKDPISARAEYREIVDRHQRLAARAQTDLDRRFLSVAPATLESRISLVEGKV